MSKGKEKIVKGWFLESINKKKIVNCKDIEMAVVHCPEGFESLDKEVQEHIKSCDQCERLWKGVEEVYQQTDKCVGVSDDKKYWERLLQRDVSNQRSVKLFGLRGWIGVAASVAIGIFMGMMMGTHMTDYLDRRAECQGMHEYLYHKCNLCQGEHGVLQDVMMDEYGGSSTSNQLD